MMMQLMTGNVLRLTLFQLLLSAPITTVSLFSVVCRIGLQV